MNELSGSYYFNKNSFSKTTTFNSSPSGPGTDLYEVLRIQDGICLFFEEHFERLLTSVRLSGNTTCLHGEDIRSFIQVLIRKNRMVRGNIKIVLRFERGFDPALLIYRIPHFYPSAAAYRNGVSTCLFKVTRDHPNVKVVLPAVRQQLTDFISSKHIYEAILVNDIDCITEGSRSNLFFIRENVLYTAPGDQILRGITRSKIIEICKILNYKLIEASISINDLNNFEASFITGTSPKVLPVKSIDNLKFQVFHPVTEAISRAYECLVKDYMEANKLLL